MNLPTLSSQPPFIRNTFVSRYKYWRQIWKDMGNVAERRMKGCSVSFNRLIVCVFWLKCKDGWETDNWLGWGDSVRELRSYYHSCHSLVQPYRFCQQSEVFSFLLFWTKWRIRMHSLYVYRFFAQLRMTGQKESKRKAKRCRALKKRWRGTLKKMPSFF